MTLPPDLALDCRLQSDGVEFLRRLPAASFPLVFFDPQYRGVLDHQKYGNEGARQRGAPSFVRCGRTRSPLPEGDRPGSAAQRSPAAVGGQVPFVYRCAALAGRHRLGSGRSDRLEQAAHGHGLPDAPDQRIPAGIAQDSQAGQRSLDGARHPDVWPERLSGTHPTPNRSACRPHWSVPVTSPGDIVVDPAAGSFSVLEACRSSGRRFLGCDISG